MTINPRDYDLDELRKMARERGEESRTPPTGDANDEGAPPSDVDGWGEPESGGSPGGPGGSLSGGAAREKFQSGLYRELMPLEAGADNLEKPYLTSLPESYAAEFVVFEWLEFLLSTFGYQGANESLQYYDSVGWITDDVQTKLNEYMLGIDGSAGSERADGDIDDHKLSLVYIARLVSMN